MTQRLSSLALALFLIVTTVQPGAASNKPDASRGAVGAELELHIEASAQILPDRVTIPLTLIGEGKSEAASISDLEDNKNYFLKRLQRSNIVPTKIIDDSGLEVVATYPDRGSFKNQTDAAECEAIAASEAVPPKGFKAFRRTKNLAAGLPVRCVPSMTATRRLLFELDSLAKLKPFIDALEVIPKPATRDFSFAQGNPEAALRSAREQALAKARADAEAYAGAMGYHVVRLVRVGNAGHQLSLRDFQQFFATLSDNNYLLDSFSPSWFGSIITEAVAIDYIIAPN